MVDKKGQDGVTAGLNVEMKGERKGEEENLLKTSV